MSFLFFPVKWDSDDKSIRIYGLRENHTKPICLHIKSWPTKFLIEFLHDTNSNDPALDERDFWKFFETMFTNFKYCEFLGKTKIRMKKIIGAHINSDGSQKEFDFWKCKISSNFVVYQLIKLIADSKFAKMVVLHEEWIDLWYQFALEKDVNICNWLQVNKFTKVDVQYTKFTICDEEYVVDHNGLVNSSAKPPPPIPTCAYDIEVYSHFETRYENRFPKATEPEDVVFMISMCFTNMFKGDYSILLSTCSVDLNLVQSKFPDQRVEVIILKSETKLLEEFNKQLLLHQPLIILGYNNLSFDHAYMMDRAKLNHCWASFQKASMCKFRDAQEKDISWSSSARADQKFIFVQGEGFSYTDLMCMIKKDYKLASYSLANVSSHFLKNDTKHDMSPKMMACIYKCWLNNKDNGDIIIRMSDLASYCLQDSLLVLKLFSQLKYDGSLIALSDLTNCKIEDLTIRGTLQKVMSLIIRFSKPLNIVVQRQAKNSVASVESYRGATVFEPLYGVWRNIISLDFASLYPSLIQAYNLCASTLVSDESKIPLDKCQVFEWEDHVGCEHDLKVNKKKKMALEAEIKEHKSKFNQDDEFEQYVIKKKELALLVLNTPDKIYCEKKRYVFYNGYKGVYPQIVEMLKNARSDVKKKMKEKQMLLNNNSEADTSLIVFLKNELGALNSQQAAIKVIANALYGFTGARHSAIPSIPIAACITYLGRLNIEKASQIIQRDFGGIRVYGDTDSNYIKLSNDLTFKQLDDLGREISNDVSAKFPSCLRIEYEEEIYAHYLIINKKQYCYLALNENGTMKEKMGVKGLLMIRRDCSIWVRECYEHVIRLLFDKKSIENIIDYVLDESLKLIYGLVPLQKLMVTKQVGSWAEKNVVKENSKLFMGRYSIRAPTPEKMKNFKSTEDYYISALPAHVQLAIRLTDLGVKVNPGERIEYLVTGLHKKNDVSMGKKIQTANIYENNRCLLSLDFYYYIKFLIKNLSTVLNICFPRGFVSKENVVVNKHNIRYKMMMIYKNNFLKGRLSDLLRQFENKLLVNAELTRLFKPKLVFVYPLVDVAASAVNTVTTIDNFDTIIQESDDDSPSVKKLKLN